MTRKWPTLIALMWLALPVIAFRYWTAWGTLPARMATHFDAAGNANGWMTPQQSLMFTLGFVAFMLTIFSVTLLVIHRKYPIGRLSWAMLVFFHFEIWSIVLTMIGVLQYNLSGKPVIAGPLLIGTPIAVLGLIAIGLSEKRGTPLPSNDVIAEETHSGKFWSALFLFPLLAFAWAIVSVPAPAIRFGAVILSIVFVGVFGMAWDGFHYYFTRNGFEIRTLGWRLKTVEADAIKQYAVGRWNATAGYGIRGLGNNRAYVWGNQGVRVVMNDGEVFLGHDDPQRIIRDLDAMKSSR